VKAEGKTSEFFWITETASKINEGCKYSIGRMDQITLDDQAGHVELFQDFYRNVSVASSAYHCGTVIRAALRTSTVRDNAAELEVTMVDFSAANDSFSKVLSLGLAKRDAEKKQRESEPKAPAPRL
jgi:hypothetical protein